MSFPTCSLSGLDLSQPCVRESLAALIPLAFVASCLFVFVLERLTPSFVALFTQWLTVEEADQITSKAAESKADVLPKLNAAVTSSIWILISVAETAVWVAIGSYNLSLGDAYASRHFAFAATWLYATVKSGQNMESPPMQLMFLYALHFIGALFMIAGDVYFASIYGSDFSGGFELLGQGANAVATLILVMCSLASPFSPQPTLEIGDEKVESHSPEDTTTIWGWLSFDWLNPLVREGTRRTLNETDIYDLGKNLQAWPLFSKFTALDSTSSLLWRLFRANSQDLMCV